MPESGCAKFKRRKNIASVCSPAANSVEKRENKSEEESAKEKKNANCCYKCWSKSVRMCAAGDEAIDGAIIINS